MDKDLLGMLRNLDSLEDKEMVLEAMSILGDPLSKRIIRKAAGPDSPVGVNEFADQSETTMIKYLRQLHKLKILSPVWLNNQRKFEITETGKEVATVIQS